MTACTWTYAVPLTTGQRIGWALVFALLGAGTALVIANAVRIIDQGLRARGYADAAHPDGPPPSPQGAACWPRGQHPYPPVAVRRGSL